MTTDKISVQRLVEICFLRGLRQVVISPGSRNAPLTIAFHEHGGFSCHTVPDERVAAFYAMGQALASGKPSIICCTSGSAALNYAPAIVESYYQGIPLLVLTADRPVDWIDTGIGQSMRQHDVYSNYIKKSFQIKQEAVNGEDLRYNDNIFIEAIEATISKVPGPVHINMPFCEPLYGRAKEGDFSDIVPNSIKSSAANDISNELLEDLSQIWKHSKRKLILIGQGQSDNLLSQELSLLSQESVVILKEATSNLNIDGALSCIDRVLAGITDFDKYKPDLLITIGGAVVSKKIKSLLFDHKPDHHWDVRLDKARDTFKSLTQHLRVSGIELIEKLPNSLNSTVFQSAWCDIERRTKDAHTVYIDDIPFSDLKVFQILLSSLKNKAVLHLANSTPVRYTQLFDPSSSLTYMSNRGVSGIDGSTSTAIGYSTVNEERNYLITGDVSFFYDSNAFWNDNKRISNLKIILINNGGGGIFRYIPGPDTTNQLESVFESHHQLTARPICELYNLEYFMIDNSQEAESVLYDFINTDFDKIALLEIKTPRLKNAKVLREYFKYIESVCG